MTKKEIVKKLVVAGHKDLAREVLALSSDEPDYGDGGWVDRVKRELANAKAVWTKEGWVSRRHIELINCKLTRLPKFKKVGINFECANNQLTTLNGSPEKVRGAVYCHMNKLITLEGSPKEVGGNFVCSNNELISLKGAPKTVGGYFDCSNNAKKFTEEEVRAICDVKGDIFV